MTQPQYVTTSVGWGVLHLFCKVTDRTDGQRVVAAVKQIQDSDHQVLCVALFGHKADIGFMALGPDLWRLRRLQSQLQQAHEKDWHCDDWLLLLPNVETTRVRR